MEEMRRQLHTLAEFQRHLLPRQIPQPEGWRLAVSYSVGCWPGGDYYDFLPLADGRILFIIADASDEGGPATAMVALVRALLHSCPLSSGVEQLPFCPFREPLLQPPHVILGHLNRVLVENSLEEQFVTAFCGVLSPAEGNLHYANAGHPSPRWWRASTRTLEAIRDAVGRPLGLGHNSAYHQKRIEIGPGDLLVWYSDGIIGALNDQGEWFSTERLDDIVRDVAPQGAEAVKAALVDGLDDFLAERVPQDDITIVVLERLA